MKHDLARKLRRNQTDVERKLWYMLRGRRFEGCKFRRQQPLGPYVADFVCLSRKIVVELDGSQHGSEHALTYDARRTAFLESQGFRVFRFWNHEVNDNLEGVMETIWRALDAMGSP